MRVSKHEAHPSRRSLRALLRVRVTLLNLEPAAGIEVKL